jgi:hypothetical protein
MMTVDLGVGTMPHLEIHLSDDNQDFINAQVVAGDLAGPSDYITRLVEAARNKFDEAEIYAYLARQSAATAHRFVDKVDETLKALCEQSTPGMP